jgi:ubiquinone/menaquinone biosynthesis C-methylase UbiE
MAMSNVGKSESQDSYYVCPVCRQPLTHKINGLFCKRDGVEYPVKNGIVDFVTEDLTKSTSPVLRSVDKLDDLAKIYEGPSWYGTMDTIHAELGLPSIEEGATMMTEMVDAKDGLGLDVACGTGFITRSIAQKMRLVYGIDISMGMLEKATEYARERGIGNMRFARSRAERLPFPDGVFDGVTCSGALHTFQDTAEALSEMARVMKSGARLAVLTFMKQDPSTLEMIFERLGASNIFGEVGLEASHLFDVEELDNYLSQTGFKGFAYNVYGPYILFHAEKG